MVLRVEIHPELLRWARERASLEARSLVKRFPKLREWEQGTAKPTLKQVESFAKATHTPIGYLFLSEPPLEVMPLPDFRTMPEARGARPSPDLLETIYACQRRQEWYAEFARATGETALPFVGSARVASDVVDTANTIRASLGFDLARRQVTPTWTDALREFIEQADTLGVLVMCSGIVGSNTRRVLDPTEFRGFAIADPLAPLVFINGADTKSAQMFTLAHELAHIWLGQSAVSDAEARQIPEERVLPQEPDEVENWCNRVAAELLVPLSAVRDEFRADAEIDAEIHRLARRFKVSTLVVLRRIHDAGRLSRKRMWELYEAELERLRTLAGGSGGNFYATLPSRVSKRFARALVESALEGHTLYRDALQLLGFFKLTTFDELGRRLGVIA